MEERDLGFNLEARRGGASRYVTGKPCGERKKPSPRRPGRRRGHQREKTGRNQWSVEHTPKVVTVH